jgi:hypothetical protein
MEADRVCKADGTPYAPDEPMKDLLPCDESAAEEAGEQKATPAQHDDPSWPGI